MRKGALTLFFLLLTALATAAAAKETVPKGKGQAVEIVDGDTLVLEDGREIRLVGIQAPKLPLGRKGFRTWPLAEEAKRTLEKLSQGKLLTLSFGGREIDRHGRLLAHLHDENGIWIQGAMLEAGMARVYSFADNRALVAEMLKREAAARAAKRGIWDHPFYRIRKASESGRAMQGFQLVEGRAFKVTPKHSRTFVNFAADWKSDFTISIKRGPERLFEQAGLPPAALDGKRIRVRGWIKNWNGPFIEATHPEQIEVLD
jgi:micrococcal nuclease